MKKVLALAGVIGSSLALAIPSVLPKLALLLFFFFPGLVSGPGPLVLPLLLIGILGLTGNPPSDSLLYIM